MRQPNIFLHWLMLLVALPILGKAQVAPEEISQTMLNESMEAVLGIKQVSWQSIPITDELKSSVKGKLKIKNKLPDTLHIGSVGTGEDNFWIIPDIAPSKSETYSFVLYLDAKKEIKDVDVLEYRENYGYEIDYSFFRKQFHGKKEADNIRFNRSIQNISGATISARSLTYAVHDLMLILTKIDLN